MKNGYAVAVIVAAAALVGLLVYGVFSVRTNTSLESQLAEGKRPAPPVRELPVLGDRARTTQSLDDYKGQVVLVNFWASWCPPCKDELPLLQKTQEKLEPKGFTIVGIDVEDAQSEALEVVSRYRLSFPSLRDYNRDYAQDFGLVGYPESFVLDRKGNVAALRRGPVDQEWIDETLPKLIAEKA